MLSNIEFSGFNMKRNEFDIEFDPDAETFIGKW